MFVSIDMDRLVFLHKHHDHETVSRLSWLECGQHTSVRIDNTDADNFLRGVTHGDLIRFYKNTTGEDALEMAWGDRAFQFRERLREVASNLPPTVALIDEVEAQVDSVEDRLYAGERFRYALGARVPAQAQELFPILGLPITQQQIKAADERAVEAKRKWSDHLEAERRGDFLPPSQRAQAGLPPLPGAPPLPPTVPEAPQLSSKPPKARSGSVQPVVFAACDAAWNDPQRVASGESWADVKARLITKLIADGLHPTTVRIKLSKWAKEKGL
jgi:hypothetical protein